MSDDDDGLTREQLRWLAIVAVGIGALLLVAIVGITAVSYTWGTNDPGDPVATFSVETDDRSDGVAANVTHSGGDAISPSSVVLEVNGERRGTWEDLGGEGPGIVSEGNQLVLSNVSVGDTVAVYREHGDDDRSEIGRGTIAVDEEE